MNIKNVAVYVLLTLLSFLIQLIVFVVYPVVYLFRHRILDYTIARIQEDEQQHIFLLKPGVKKWHLYLSPLFWGFLFTTGLTDKYCGDFWYKRKQKEKWFTEFVTYGDDPNSKYPVPKTLKQKIQYFWLSYMWGGMRNGGWAFSEWFMREGQADPETMKIFKSKTPYSLDLDIMPGAKFKDREGNYMNNSGDYIRYTFDSDEKWTVTNEGMKILIFNTGKGNHRFYYGNTRIHKIEIIKRFLVIELLFGWDWWDGMRTLHAKFMFKNMDSFAIMDFDRYLSLGNLRDH